MDKSQAIKKQGVNAAKWTIFDRAGSQILLLVNTIILARLLDPKDYGLLSMLYIFTTIAGLFVDSGMGGGLIKKKDITQEDCSTFFYFNITVASFLFVVLYVAAPFISDFYGEPILSVLLRVLSLNMVIGAFGIIHKILLTKELHVKLVSRSSLFGSLIGCIVGIICAYSGLGVWSLVILNITQTTIMVIMLWRFSGWIPSKVFSVASFKELYAFGLGLFLSSFIDLIFKNIYQPLIGKLFSPAYTGFYYQARRLYEVPILTISQGVDSIAFPLLAKFQEKREELEENYQKIVNLLIFISFPVIIAIVLMSKDIVLIMLGEKWLFAAELLKILSISGVFLILETSNRSLLKIEGKTKLIFKLEVVKKIFIVVAILLTFKFGITALMYGMLASSIFSFSLNQYFTSVRITDYQSIFLVSAAGLLMAIVIVFVNYLRLNPYIAVLVGGGFGVGIYLTFSFVFRVKALDQLLAMANIKIKR